MIYIYVSNRDRLECLRKGLEFLVKLPNSKVIVLDNASTYSPLLEYYKTECPVQVIRLPENLGPRVTWSGQVSLPNTGYYVSTDGDINYLDCPLNVLEILQAGMEKYSNVCKIGLNEDIDLIPPGGLRDTAEVYLRGYWKKKRDSFFYEGDVDCTFAMYRGGMPHCQYGPALRTDRPYVCSQYGWSLDPAKLPEDELYYLKHIPDTFRGAIVWSTVLQQALDNIK